MEKIYNTAFDLIELRLRKKEQVLPFTVVLEGSESKPIVSMYEQVVKDVTMQIKVIRNDLRQKVKNEKIVALCLCYDLTVTDPRTNEKTDAILIEVANKDNGTVNIYIPYSFNDEQIIKKPFQNASDQKYY